MSELGSTISVDPRNGPPIIMNSTDVGVGDVASALDRANQPIIAALVRWSSQTSRPSRRGSFFERDRFVSPEGAFAEIVTAREAMKDDIVEGVAETTEALAFRGCKFHQKDLDQDDAWNQFAENVDLDSRMREAWQILFSDSQFVCALWWEKKTFKLRGRGPGGAARRKTLELTLPTAMSFIDSLKVVPVGTLMFNRERLAYIANSSEAARFDEILGNRPRGQMLAPFGMPTEDGLGDDDIVERLVVGRYRPDPDEQLSLRNDGITDVDNLFLLREDSVFRHTLTRPQYQRFARNRMRSVFPLLDMKSQLQQMDRAHLIGGTNFIVLIKKGSDKLPAEPEEIANLQASVRVIASVPVIVGDHRLSVEIVTPKLDTTLNRSRYDTVNVPIAARLFQTFLPTGSTETDPLKLGKIIAEGLESRRHQMKRAFEAAIIKRAIRINDALTDKPTLRFVPDQISLSFDAGFATAIGDARAANELSRDTFLGVLGLDQELEADLREREADLYDETFKTQEPHGTRNPALPEGPNGGKRPIDGPGADKSVTRTGGRRAGGTRNGGGAAPGTGQGKPKNDGGTK